MPATFQGADFQARFPRGENQNSAMSARATFLRLPTQTSLETDSAQSGHGTMRLGLTQPHSFGARVSPICQSSTGTCSAGSADAGTRATSPFLKRWNGSTHCCSTPAPNGTTQVAQPQHLVGLVRGHQVDPLRVGLEVVAVPRVHLALAQGLLLHLAGAVVEPGQHRGDRGQGRVGRSAPERLDHAGELAPALSLCLDLSRCRRDQGEARSVRR